MLKTRSQKPERIDTGDYTPEEYERFLREIAFINRYFGDRNALKKTLFREIEAEGLSEFSVLDVGSGSGELLRVIAEFAKKTGRIASLIGLDLNEISARITLTKSNEFPEIAAVRGNAFTLPFADKSFDYAISSLFFHHLTDGQIPVVLKEMSRVVRRGIIVIDLHRHPLAYLSYKVFCGVFGISRLVREDGSLSVLKGFKPGELRELAGKAEMESAAVRRYFPFRIVLMASGR